MQDAPALEGAGNELTSIEVESKLDAYGSDRRSVVHSEAGGWPQIGEVEIARTRKHVPGISEENGIGSAQYIYAQFGVEHDEPVAAGRET